ncbi:Lrp/AsnC family transcriptional regulator [Pseudoroseicyclus sp. H15]
MQLDRTDRRIVAALMADATITTAKLAEMVGLSPTPCWKRVQRLQEQGVILGRVALVAPEKLGFALCIFAEVEAPEQTSAWRRAFGKAVAEIPEVIEAHRVAGGFDYMLRIVARDVAHYDEICRRLADAIPLRNITSLFVLENVKRAGALPMDLKE